MTNFKRKKKRLTVEECISKAERYDKRYIDVMIHSIDRYAPDERSELIHEFLSKENRGAFKATNPHSSRLLMAELLDTFVHSLPRKERRNDEMVPCALVTITHEGWACADTSIEFDLAKAKKRVRTALAGTSFIACFESAHYLNRYYCDLGSSYEGAPDGRLINFHCHAVVWSGSRYQLDQLRKRLKRRFDPVPGNKSSVNISKLRTKDDVARAVIYMSKAPYLGYTTSAKNGGRTQSTTSRVPHKARMRLFQGMSKFKPSICGLRVAMGSVP